MKQLFFVLVAAFVFSSSTFSQTAIQPGGLDEFATIVKAVKSGDREAFDKEFGILSKKYSSVTDAYKKAIINAGLKPTCLQDCDTQYTMCMYPPWPQPFGNYNDCSSQRMWCYVWCGATNPTLASNQK
jgi:hypothetical protein